MLPINGVIRKRIFKVILRSLFIFERRNQDWTYFFAISLSSVRILALFMRWWFRTRRLLSFFDKFCLILSFHIWGIACINWAHWKYMSLSRWYSSFNVCHFLNWQDSFTNWSTKLIFFCENLVKLTIELSIIICLLNHRFLKECLRWFQDLLIDTVSSLAKNFCKRMENVWHRSC